MAWQLSPVIYALVVAGVVNLALFAVTWPRRDVTGARSFLLVLGIITVWSFGGAFRYAALDPAVHWTVYVIPYLAVIVAPPATLTFVLEYTGREEWLTRRRLTLLWAFPALLLVAAVTNRAHELLWQYGPLVRTSPVVVYDISLGPLGWLNAVFSYGILLAAFGLLVQQTVRTRGAVRRQAAIIAVALLAPLVTSMLWVFGWSPVPDVDLTGFALTASDLLIAVSLFRFDLLDLAPVARHTLVEEMDDAVLVVDDDGRITDANPTARDLFDPDLLVGMPVAHVVPAYDRLVERTDGGSVDVSLETDGGERQYEARRSSVTDGRGQPVGYLITLRDVTERKRRERQLQRQNEQLDEFASVVSHDLRNPINVVEGRIELTRQTGDLSHLDAAETATGRMGTIIDDMLALARQGKTVSDTEPVDVGDLAERAWETVETPGATLAVDATLTVDADPDRLRQALENVFRNAVEHGSTGNRTSSDDAVERGSTSPRSETRGDAVEHGPEGVTVRVADLPDGTGFAVEDDGPGIPAEERETVFESGYTTDQDGTGLGLAIVESVVEAHGWSVRVTEGTDGGARFEIVCR